MSTVKLYTTHYTLGDEELPGYLQWTDKINKHYCACHGYDWIVRDVGLHTRPHPWSRVYHALKLAREFEGPGLLMFIDGDAFVRDQSKMVEQLAEKYLVGGAVFVAAPDIRDAKIAYHPELPNAGVFILKLPDALEFLEDWWRSPDMKSSLIYDSGRYLDASDSLHHHPFEQLALWHLYESAPDKVALTADYKELNGADGDYVTHMMATRPSARIGISQTFWESIK